MIVALWAVRVAKSRGVDSKYTYGWQRAEILGALINAVFLIALCMTICLEAIQRLIEVPVITNPKLVAAVGAAGLISNILGLFLFHEHGHSHGGSGHSHGHGLDSIDEETLLESNSHSHSQNRDIPNSDDSSFTQKIADDSRPIAEALPSSYMSRLSESARLLDAADHSSSSNGYGSLQNNKHSHSHDSDDTPDEHSHEHSHGDTPTPSGHNRSLSSTHTDHFHARAKAGTGSSKSLNMEGVFLHVLGDALGNIGVIMTAFFIWKTEFWWRYYMDPVISLIITAIIFSSAMPLCRRTSAILLQAVPQTVNADEVRDDIVSLPGIYDIHDLHIWILREDLYVATLHVSVSSSPQQFMHLAQQIRTCMKGHGIASTTIQPEFISKSHTNSICSNSRLGEVSTGGLSAVNPDVAEQYNVGASNNGTTADSGTITPACVLQGNHTAGGLSKANKSP